MTTTKKVTIPLSDGRHTVSAILNTAVPAKNGRSEGMVMAHGAANDMHNELLAYLAEGAAANGIPTLRFNFLYREMKKKSPDTQKRLEQTWIDVFGWFSDRYGMGGNIIAAGKSLGARIASQTASQGRLAARRLVFFGYPLHAPGKSHKLRDQHLYQIQVPMLFFCGTRDVFCRLDRLDKVTANLPGSWQKNIIAGADHSFGLTKADPRPQRAVYTEILEALLRWIH